MLFGQKSSRVFTSQARVRCPYCGSLINVDPSNPHVHCPHCQHEFDVEMQGRNRGFQSMGNVNRGLEALTRLVARLAKGDGQVSKQEIEVFDRFTRQVGLDKNARIALSRVFNEEKSMERDYRPYISELHHMFSGQTTQFFDAVLVMLKDVAKADGHIGPQEEKIIRETIQVFGHRTSFSYETLLAGVTGSTDAYYNVLGLQPGCGSQALKKKHRELAKEYHPDKHSGRGMSESALKQIEDKFKSINEAYDVLKVVEA